MILALSLADIEQSRKKLMLRLRDNIYIYRVLFHLIFHTLD